MRGNFLFAALLSGVMFTSMAQAAMDAESQGLLISKLQSVYATLAMNDPSKVAVTLRLADLYAERARQTAMKDGDARADREKALKLYGEVLERAPESVRAKVALQIGHLNQLNGNEDKAIAFYQRNLKTEKDAAALAETHLSLGEIHFKRRDYAQALNHFGEVISLSKGPGRGLAAYRQAWSNFHMGRTAIAIQQIENLLSTPEMLNRSTIATGQADVQFHEEVSRDYVTFLSKGAVNQDVIDKLLRLSPQSTKLTNGVAFAYDLERLGKREEALLAWNTLYGELAQPADRVAASLSIAQLSLDKGDKASALKSYESAMQNWKEAGIKPESEAELKRRARNFPVAWNQMEKAKPSAELLAAYDLYLSVFPTDIDTQLYAAQIAKDQGNNASAWSHYVAARDLLLQDATKNADKLETVLLSQIELGEGSKDPALTQQSYESYVVHSVKKSKLQEVQYQKARALYDAGNYAAASVEMRTIALSGKGSAQIRKQAADLSLDSLVLLKDEANLVPWAQEYEKAFPQQKADFSSIIQKTVLTKSAALAEANPAGALAALAAFDASSASPEDKVKFYKNRMILAEKQGDLKLASASADALLALPNVSAEDKEMAWGRKAYFAELRLDFTTAFSATEKLQKTLPADEKSLKLGLFAELSGRQSAPFYISYLKQTKDADRKQLVAAEVVRKSKNPEGELEKVKGVLASSPALLAQLYAEVFAKNGKDAIVKKVTADAKMRETDAGKLLARQAFLKDYAVVKKSLANDKIDTSTTNKLAASIKRRAGLLVKAENMAQKSIQSGDWTAQLVSIDLVGREAERFYQDLMAAPMPSGLSPEEEQEYLSLLSAQASPYQMKATEAKTKVGQFWSATDWAAPLKVSWEQKPIRKLIMTEIEALKEIAPEDQVAKLSSFKDGDIALSARPSLAEMQQARQKVFENPMDRKALEDLLILEKKSDNLAMSEYLSTRLERLTKGNL